jgi:hypothetical protein
VLWEKAEGPRMPAANQILPRALLLILDTRHRLYLNNSSLTYAFSNVTSAASA